MNDNDSITTLRDAPDASAVYRIWPGDGHAPGSESWTHAESTMPIPWAGKEGRRLTRNVVIPTLTMFRPPEGRANGTSIVIAPGGAFHFLMIDHEGYEMARWMSERGVTAFVLKYRLARSPDDDSEVLDFRNDLQRQLGEARISETAPPNAAAILGVRTLSEEDGRQAITFVRQHAAEFGLDPQKIGIAGFSAGGGVAMGAAMLHDRDSRPDFVCGIYPAWRADMRVPVDAPPLFLVISDDDRSVSPVSTARLYESWHKAGFPVELHIFGNGAHGFGMGENGLLSDPWIDLFGHWMRQRGLMA